MNVDTPDAAVAIGRDCLVADVTDNHGVTVLAYAIVDRFESKALMGRPIKVF